jgi:pimeloyl-ACP methyl ester carboxylesterase
MIRLAASVSWSSLCIAAVMVFVPAAAGAPAAAAETSDEVFPESDLLAGKRTNRSECEATRHAVWVEHKEGSACIRYFPSSNVEGAKTAAFFFHGDRLNGRFVIQGAYRDNKTSVLLKASEYLSRINGTPYIFVGRPGVYGSSGVHGESRRLHEFLTMNAAVDAIKARHRVELVHLVGQSGGANVVGALLTLGRTDVVCAVASSGAFDPLARARDLAMQKAVPWRGCDTNGVCDPYSVTEHVNGVAPARSRRIFLVGDPQDSNTAYRYQQAFADKLAGAGHTVVMLPAEALTTDPQRHALAHMANRVLGWCNAGFDTEHIAALVRANALGLHATRPNAEQPKPKESLGPESK